MVKFYRKSVSLSALWVSTNERVSDFYASSWQRGDSPIPMLVIRLLLMGVALAILIWSLVEAPNPYWLIYLTNWGLMLDVGMFLCALVVSISVLCNRPNEEKELPWYASLYWVVFNIAVTLSIMITTLYWVLLYNPEFRDEMPDRAFWLDVSTHGITSCLMMVEVLVSRTPVRFLHLYQPLGMGLWYAVFSAIYYAAGGTDINGSSFIYEVLDWSEGRRTSIVVTASMAGLIIVYACVWGIALCRDKLSTVLIRTTSHDLAAAPPDRHTRIV
ncbi:protein rolling stone [Helicoverpa armigera]|uniref:protein rolling stone n=1 Tax=Helicoverpa armigera TaxID=29058 RepID=UPI003082D445